MSQAKQAALQNLKAKAPHEADDVTGVGGDETVSEALSKNVFSSYVCTSIQKGVPHPGDIAEPTSLRSPSCQPSNQQIPACTTALTQPALCLQCYCTSRYQIPSLGQHTRRCSQLREAQSAAAGRRAVCLH